MTVPVPLVIAHRGASAAAPENTIAAFERALTDGADAIQLDVHLSRDDHPVVIHDPILERTTNGSGPVRGHTMRELKRLDAGAWRGPAFAGQRLQTLQEVLERFRGRTRFWIELKGGPDLYPDVEERIVGLLEVYDVIDGALVQTFDPAALARLRAFSRELSLGAVLARSPLDVERDVPPAASAVCPSAEILGAPEREAIRRSGRQCHVWTVNEPALMDRLVDWSVDGIITDRPDLLRARLQARSPG
ncbi:MAG TPA: glycerophosphodiester phosphodiesterase family protein [Pseudomonadales bacterium]|nr:glycerophosphodiester phosphodiesterase family protein [Pseudomonadales bacterium]